MRFARRPQTLLRLASWVSGPGLSPCPGAGSRLALHPSSLPVAPRPSTPSSSPPAPPPPAAGWGDVTGLGAPTCRRGRGRRQPPGTLRGHRPPPPSSDSSLGLTQPPSSALVPFFLFSRPGSGHRGGDEIGFERSASARGGRYASRGLIRPRLHLLLPHTHPPGSFQGSWPFPGPPVAIVCVWGGGALGSLWVGQQEGALHWEGFLGVVWEGQIWDSFDYWGIPRPGGLLLLPTSPGRRDEKVG